MVTQNGYHPLFNAAALWSTIPFADSHCYFQHPSQWTSPGSEVKQSSAVENAAGYFRGLNAQRLYGRPFGVGEFNHCFWNFHQYEMPLVFTAYAAFQGYSTLAIHSHPVILDGFWKKPRLSCFSVAPNPILRSGEFLGHQLFLRGDLRSAEHKIMLTVPDKYLFVNGNGNRALSSEQSKLALLTGVGTAFPGRPLPTGLSKLPKPDLTWNISDTAKVITHDWFSRSVDTADSTFSLDSAIHTLRNQGILSQKNCSDANQEIFQSDTEEITLKTDKKQITVNTPKTQAAALVAGSTVTLSSLKVKHCSVNALIAVTSVDKYPIIKSNRLVVVLATAVVNKGMQLDGRNPAKLVKLSKGPALMRTGKFSLAVSNKNTGKWKAYALRSDGIRLGELSLKQKKNELIFETDTSQLPKGPTTFFELVRN